MPADPETILDALAAGLTIDKAAEQFDMPADEVRELLKAEIERCHSGEHLREAWTLADRRLEAVEHKFFNKAIEGDGDTAAAMVFIKTNERRAILNGANMPSHHVLEVVRRSEPPKQNSTERIYEVISRIAKIPYKSPNGSELEPSTSNGDAQAD